MKSKIEIKISVIDDGPVLMRCEGQNTSRGKAMDALEDAYVSTVVELMRKDLSKADQEEAAKEFGEMMRDRENVTLDQWQALSNLYYERTKP